MNKETSNEELRAQALRTALRLDEIEGRLYATMAVAHHLLRGLPQAERQELREAIGAQVDTAGSAAQFRMSATAALDELLTK